MNKDSICYVGKNKSSLVFLEHQVGDESKEMRWRGIRILGLDTPYMSGYGGRVDSICDGELLRESRYSLYFCILLLFLKSFFPLSLIKGRQDLSLSTPCCGNMGSQPPGKSQGFRFRQLSLVSDNTMEDLES